MRVTADTNILVRAVMGDHPLQSTAAAKLLREAELICIPLTSLCELVWVLGRTYRMAPERISAALRSLLTSPNVATDRPAAEAGLWVFEQGGDFADGVIEFEGRHLGGTSFASFDRNAVRLLERAGLATFVPT